MKRFFSFRIVLCKNAYVFYRVKCDMHGSFHATALAAVSRVNRSAMKNCSRTKFPNDSLVKI